MKVTIQRIHQNDCTVGLLNAGDFRCFTLELPWKENQKRISCIPAGRYYAIKHKSPKLGASFWIQEVSGRTEILIHKGNYTRQIQGCILVGKTLADINHDGIPDVTSSVDTMKKLYSILPSKFELEIK